MPDKSITDQCKDPTKELTIEIPCRLAERVEIYAKQNGSNIPHVVIEALDEFLREKTRIG